MSLAISQFSLEREADVDKLLADGRSVKTGTGLNDGTDSIFETGGPSETGLDQTRYQITANHIQVKPISVTQEEGLQEELEMLQEEIEVLHEGQEVL